MDDVFWLVMPIFILWGINELLKPDANKQLQEIRQQQSDKKKAFEEKWKAKAITQGKETLISNIQKEITLIKEKIDSMCYGEGHVIYDPYDSSTDDEDGSYRIKYDAYLREIAQLERTISYVRTLS